MGESASSDLRFAALCACPGCGLSAWIRSAKGASVPRSASIVIAHAMSTLFKRISRSTWARQWWASIPSVPFKSARPSLACSATGVTPAAARTGAASVGSPRFLSSSTHPLPVRTSAA